MLSFLCPICGEKLKKNDFSYKCRNGHSFDISRKGYVNLLTTNGRNPQKAGDNKEMIRARSYFLDSGAYLPLAEMTGRLLGELCPKEGADIIDAGCGEGYYTCVYAKMLRGADIYGIDISKHGIDHAASRARNCEPKLSNVHLAVGSAFRLPFKSGVADAVVSTFAPVSNDEYSRVLRRGGKLVIVSPAPKHLFSLKALLYDKPYENEPNIYALGKFEHTDTKFLEYTAHIADSKTLKALFAMTPYYYKTSAKAASRLDSVNGLDIECAFEIRIYTAL